MPKKQSDEPAELRGRDNDGLHKRRGIWYYSLEIAGKRRFFSTKTRSYQEARKVRANAIKAQQENRLPTEMAKWPFERLLAQVREDRTLHIAENTDRIEKERSGPLLKAFQGRRVCEVDNAAIRDYQKKRAKQVGNRTINLECKLLRLVLKAAKVWAHVADEYKPLPEDRRGPGRALEPAEEKLLFNTAKSKPEWDAAFYAALAASNTTMRGHELKKLRLADVDLVNGELVIRKSKTNAGERKIPLNGAAVWAFAKLLERANALGATEPEHFLFPGFKYKQTKSAAAPRGTGYDPERHQKTWRSAWRSLVKETAKRAGNLAHGSAVAAGAVPESAETERKKAMAAIAGLRFHDLRHCAITRLAESEASDQTIMSIAGHLDRKMLEHYSHIRNAAKRKALDAICSYMPEKLPFPKPQRACNEVKPARVYICVYIAKSDHLDFQQVLWNVGRGGVI
jgi:integrase